MFPLKKPAPVVRAQNVVWQYLLVYKNRYDLLALKSHIKYVQIMDFGQVSHNYRCNPVAHTGRERLETLERLSCY